MSASVLRTAVIARATAAANNAATFRSVGGGTSEQAGRPRDLAATLAPFALPLAVVAVGVLAIFVLRKK